MENKINKEEYLTLAFNSFSKAKKAKEEIKEYFKDRIICAEIIQGTDERGNTGFMIVYALTKK